MEAYVIPRLSPLLGGNRTITDEIVMIEKQSSLPSLTEPQLTKLKQLSLITIASQQPEKLTYASLQRLLDIPTIRALEDLVISAIYASLLSGKLDTASSRVEVSSTAGRDLAPNDVENMITLLTAWTGQCESVLREINEQVDIITKDGIMQRKVWARYEQEVRQRRESKEVKAMASGGGGGGRGKRLIEGEEQMWGGGGDDELDLDDGPFGDDGPGGGGKKKKMGASLASIGVANFALGRRKRRD